MTSAKADLPRSLRDFGWQATSLRDLAKAVRRSSCTRGRANHFNPQLVSDLSSETENLVASRRRLDGGFACNRRATDNLGVVTPALRIRVSVLGGATVGGVSRFAPGRRAPGCSSRSHPA